MPPGLRRNAGLAPAAHDGRVTDVNRLGPVLRHVRLQPDGLLLLPLWSRPELLVPWTRIKGVRIWPGLGDHPLGRRYRYAIQVRLAGEWKRVGRTLPVRHSVWPDDVREFFLGPHNVRTPDERRLLRAYELVRTLWEQGGGTSGDEDDRWLHVT